MFEMLLDKYGDITVIDKFGVQGRDGAEQGGNNLMQMKFITMELDNAI